jgi:hypothetical protein
MPARILAQNVNGKDTGAYQTCGFVPEQYDIFAPQFFLYHPYLAWVQTNGQSASSVSGAITVGGSLVGRINYAAPSGIFQAIGRVQNGVLTYYQPVQNQETTTSNIFEVLACQDKPSTINCGALLDFKTNNITEFGFASGVYKDGSILYPGTANFFQCFSQNPRYLIFYYN